MTFVSTRLMAREDPHSVTTGGVRQQFLATDTDTVP